MSTDVPATLVVLYAQTLALSGLFVAAGGVLLARLLPEDPDWPRPLSFVYGASYFLGSAFLQVVLVLGARVTGSARAGFGLGLIALAALAWRACATRGIRFRARDHAIVGTAALLLVAAFTVTNATAWLEAAADGPSLPPHFLAHFGSVHSGRYANYSIFIDTNDQIPAVAQNMGQSLMASLNLMLGAKAPLAALTVWIPTTLTALALLIFGVFGEYGLSRPWSAAGTCFVFTCNVAFSLTAVFLLDNGFPIAVIGYADAITSIATFLLFGLWLRDRVVFLRPMACRGSLLPALLAFSWVWSAPQNVVIALAVTVATLMRGTRGGVRRLLAAAWPAALAFGAAALLGATQLGPFLPSTLHETAPIPVIPLRFETHVRPAVPYMRTHWTNWRYVEIAAHSSPTGRPRTPNAPAARAWASLAIESARLYGFLLLGLAALLAKVRGSVGGEKEGERLHAWLWMASVSFVVGYTIVLLLDVGGHKWWLTRFLLPATATCLMAGVLAIAPSRGTAGTGRAVLGAAVLVFGATGPLVELSTVFRRSFIERASADPLAHRVDLLVRSRGPFALDRPPGP